MDELREAAVEQLLESDMVIRDALVWKQRGVRLRMKVTVDNSVGEAVRLDYHISMRAPWAYSLCLLWGNRPVRRLDVRGSHRDQTGLISERWARRTHKHAFRDGMAMSFAYTPSDIPPTPGHRVASGEYEGVFRAFCRECGISVESGWSEPPLATHVTGPLPLSGA